MVIRVYWASVTSSRKIDGQQTRLRYILDSLKLESEWIDIAVDAKVRDLMRTECANPKAIPPQIFNGENYLGDSDAMEEFVEQERTRDFFQLQEEEKEEGCDTVDGPVANSNNSNNQNPLPRISQTVAPVLTQAPSDSDTISRRSNSSPTSSVENERPTTPTAAPENSAAVKMCDEPTEKPKQPKPTRNSVLARASTFENVILGNNQQQQQQNKGAEKPKVIFTKSKNSEAPPKRAPMDDERRRRILGL